MANEHEVPVVTGDPKLEPYPYLATLNDAQRTGESAAFSCSLHVLTVDVLRCSSIAVTYPPDAPLQVLAGPGSGKSAI